MATQAELQTALAELIKSTLAMVKAYVNENRQGHRKRVTAMIDGVELEAVVVFSAVGVGGSWRPAAEAIEKLTTGTKCWHTCWMNNGPFSEYSGSADGWRLSVHGSPVHPVQDSEPVVEHQPLMVKVRLCTAVGDLVQEVYSLPFQHWPQAYWWGQRMFVRDGFREDLACTQSEPPLYYEVLPVSCYSGEDMAKLGIV